MSSHEAEGDIVSGPPALRPDINAKNVILNGSTVTLRPLRIEDSPRLYKVLGGPANDVLYKYLPGGPFHNLESFTEHIKFICTLTVFWPFTILLHGPKEAETRTTTPVGIIALLNIVPSNRSVEIGHVLFAPSLQRTTAATESIYLLMKYCFEDLHYLRVEWKANSRNEPSKRAALRAGFVFEGIFRKHMIVKGRGRDSAWYSCIDDEWFLKGKGGVKAGLEKWLDKGNFDTEGRQVRKLEEVRDALDG